MTQKDKKYIIEFYEKQVKVPGMPKSETLTDKNLKDLKDTLWFARWVLTTKYNECVNSIKNIIKHTFNDTRNKNTKLPKS